MDLNEIANRMSNIGKDVSRQQGMDGKKNIYTCSRGHVTPTIDRDEGTTPYEMPCTADGCDAKAVSRMYHNVHPDLVPTHEWIKPESTEGFDKYRKEHVENGGLLLRRIKGNQPSGAELIAGERLKQQCKYSAKWDDMFTDGRLKQAAIFLLTNEPCYLPEWDENFLANKYFDASEIDKLITAGALISAEIDRLLRAEGKEVQS